MKIIRISLILGCLVPVCVQSSFSTQPFGPQLVSDVLNRILYEINASGADFLGTLCVLRQVDKTLKNRVNSFLLMVVNNPKSIPFHYVIQALQKVDQQKNFSKLCIFLDFFWQALRVPHLELSAKLGCYVYMNDLRIAANPRERLFYLM